MDLKASVIALAMYAVLPGLVVVSAVYFLTHSGFYMLVVAGVGLLLAAGGAGGGAVGAGATDTPSAPEISGLMVERPSGGGYKLRELLLLLGSGLLGWALVVLAFFQGGLR